MGFFKKIFGIQNINTVDKNINDAESPTADQTELESIQEPQRGWYTMSELSEIGANTDSGVNITPINAFNRITTVFACVDRRATALAKLPFDVYRKVGDNKRIPATEHRLHYLLTRRPNKYQSPMMYKKYILTCQLLCSYSKKI